MTVIAIVWGLLLLFLAALTIDGGLAISQRERAADLADQAARTEADNLDLQALRSTGRAEIKHDGCALARAYVRNAAAAIHDGTASVKGGCTYPMETVLGPGGQGAIQSGSVTVQVQLTYSPFVLDIFGGTITVTESGTAFAQAGN